MAVCHVRITHSAGGLEALDGWHAAARGASCASHGSPAWRALSNRGETITHRGRLELFAIFVTVVLLCRDSLSSSELTGRTAVVTGTAQGIGAAIASALTADGATVHGVDRDTADLTEPQAVAAFFDSLGPVDILVNNAGGVVGQVHQPLEEVSVEDWRAVVDANLTSAFLCTRAVVAGMKERRGGRIVNISSGAGRSVSLTGIQAYASSKAGMIGFTRQMAHELGPAGITVNCIAPGFVLSNPTSMAQWESYGPEGQDALVRGIALRRLGRPEDIAAGVQWFVSDAASWVTGQTISIDGGHALF